ncbi:MAG: hypothetical protein KME40_28165 [Komarekiella atlantica HA4396-MV6]|jgi:hypothetical protein|nr:hypothetical protein [Komarekiella atlantica HA4396-MV6]
MRTGFPNLGTPLATSRETRPTQWLNFSRQRKVSTDKLSVFIGVPCGKPFGFSSRLRRETLPQRCLTAARLHLWFNLPKIDSCKRLHDLHSQRSIKHEENYQFLIPHAQKLISLLEQSGNLN